MPADDTATAQPRELPLVLTTWHCENRVFVVTGANTGLGFHAAKHLVAHGAAKVIMAVRNLGAGEAAKASVETDTGKTGVAAVWELDLASYASTKAFALRCAAELDRLDVVIENAAVASHKRVTAEGHHLPLTVNVLSTFLLGVLLLPQLEATARRFPDPARPPHLTFVVSSVSFRQRNNWLKIKDDPLNGMDHLDDETLESTYSLTKLLEILALLHLTPQIPQSRTGVAVNMVCPGLCRTELARDATPEFRAYITKMYDEIGRTAECGSRTLLHGATAEHAGFFMHCKPASDMLPSWFTDEEGKESQKRVWDAIAQELEKIEPGCIKRILEG